eukprot:COSAG02_NODE_283_length_25709_cov_24.523311_2_plen_64_part_00
MQWRVMQVGNYILAEELLTAAVAECGKDGPSFELLKKRATAREKKGRGQPAADNGESRFPANN